MVKDPIKRLASKIKFELNRRDVYPVLRLSGVSAYLVLERDGVEFKIRISDHAPRTEFDTVLHLDRFEGKKVLSSHADISIHPGSDWTWKRAVSEAVKFSNGTR